MQKANVRPSGFYTMFQGKSVYARLSHLVDHECVFKVLTENDVLLESISVPLPEFATELNPNEFFVQTRADYRDMVRDALASGMFKNTGRTSPDNRRIPIWTLVK